MMWQGPLLQATNTHTCAVSCEERCCSFRGGEQNEGWAEQWRQEGRTEYEVRQRGIPNPSSTNTPDLNICVWWITEGTTLASGIHAMSDGGVGSITVIRQ